MAGPNIDYSKLGGNIRGLREAYGDTQLELALALGLNSTGAIANYENGDRIPIRDVLVKIAQRYHVTVSELINGNFANMRNVSARQLNDHSYNKAMFDKLLPIVCTEEALQNTTFRQAYSIHNKIYQAIVKSAEIDPGLIDRCMGLYAAARDEGVIEGAANNVWWIMFFGIITSLMTPQLLQNISRIEKKDATVKDFLLLGFLGEFGESSDEDSATEYEQSRRDYLDEYEVKLLVDIHRLKHSNKYADLADYYLALRYEFNLLSNSLTPEMNKAVGDEMMITLSMMSNPYAEAFCNASSHESD